MNYNFKRRELENSKLIFFSFFFKPDYNVRKKKGYYFFVGIGKKGI